MSHTMPDSHDVPPLANNSGQRLCQHGLWPSPLSPTAMAAGKRLSDAAWDTDGQTVVWLEGRSERNVLVAAGDGGRAAARDLTTDINVRALVGYGGGDFTVSHGHVFFAGAESGRIYRQNLRGGSARPITPAGGHAAAPRISPDGRWLLYVHHDADGNDRLAVIDTSGRQWPRILAQGADFYSSHRWSPDGQSVAYLSWNHPHMPWDSTLLSLGRVVLSADDPQALPHLADVRVIAGNDETSIFQPEFTPDGKTLLYVSDAPGFWQLHKFVIATGQHTQLTSFSDAEVGTPSWAHELRTYAVTTDGQEVLLAVNKRGFRRWHRLDLATGSIELVTALAEYTDISQPAFAGHRFVFVGSSPSTSPRLVMVDFAASKIRMLARATGETLLPQDLSQPTPLTWRSADQEPAHGLYFPPQNSGYRGTSLPPLLVIVHGGPTSQVYAGFLAQAQFFTTRGYAVLYPNYRGSTGYGRAYMQKLRGAWGKLDVDDAVTGARWLASTGKVDGARMAIMGGSAGGYTVLQTMVDEPEAFAAGISLYGIANQFTLVAGTHKFESHYTDALIGKLPEAAALYRERSPVFHAARIKRPLAIFQGDKDQVVPKDQAEDIVAALKRTGTPHLYHLYEGEGHGWRRAATIEHFYKTVEKFLRDTVLYT